MLAATGTHPWSSWREQRIIDTPHYRRNDELLRYVVWRNNSFGLHVHVGIRGADRRCRSAAPCGVLPELLALSASSPFVEGVYTYLHSARTQIFTRMFPRCGVPDSFPGWAEWERYVRFLYDTGSITEHTQLWWSVRPHLAFPTVELRICDAPARSRRGALSLGAHVRPRGAARARDRRGERLPDLPHRLIEENFWRAIRYGLSGELIDLTSGAGCARPAPRWRELVEWVLPVAEELGAAAQQLAIPDANAAERQIARHDEGASLEEIFAEQVRPREESVRGAEGSGIWTPGGEHRPRREQPPPEQPPQEELTAEQVAQLMRELKIADFLLSNVSTLAQLAYTKLDRLESRPARGAAGHRCRCAHCSASSRARFRPTSAATSAGSSRICSSPLSAQSTRSPRRRPPAPPVRSPRRPRPAQSTQSPEAPPSGAGG